MKAKEKEGKILIGISKRNPKPNAPKYEIETIEQLFNILTKENYKRFLKDFEKGIEVCLSIRDISKAIGKTVKIDNNQCSMKKFTWTDD